MDNYNEWGSCFKEMETEKVKDSILRWFSFIFLLLVPFREQFKNIIHEKKIHEKKVYIFF